MQENPFSDSVPTHFAIAATVYTKSLTRLEEETRTNKSRLIFVVGGYGNGKSHALERLKNDININEKGKLAIYSSAYATKSLRRIYEQVCSELLSGKISKLEDAKDSRVILESKGVPEKIVELLISLQAKGAEEMREELRFGKNIASSADAINFLAAVALLVDQFVLLIDDIEEAVTMEKSERQAFLGYIRALYDQAVRQDLNMVVAIALTPQKLELVKEDRADLYGRLDRKIEFEKPTIKEFSDIIRKRLDLTGLDNFTIGKDALDTVYNGSDSIRDMLNLLRDAMDKAVDQGSNKIESVEVPQKRAPRARLILPGEVSGVANTKPADDDIINVLKEEEGLRAEEIVKRSGKSGSWIRHRLADLVKAGVLNKQQEARNKPAKYYLTKKGGDVSER